jgi:hypothetical protein
VVLPAQVVKADTAKAASSGQPQIGTAERQQVVLPAQVVKVDTAIRTVIEGIDALPWRLPTAGGGAGLDLLIPLVSAGLGLSAVGYGGRRFGRARH